MAITREQKAMTLVPDLLTILDEGAADIISVHDSFAGWLVASRSVERVLGYTAEEMAGRGGYTHIHPDDSPIIESMHEALLATATPHLMVMRMRRADGEYVWLETTVRLVRNDEHPRGRIVAIWRDLTGIREPEKAETRPIGQHWHKAKRLDQATQ